MAITVLLSLIYTSGTPLESVMKIVFPQSQATKNYQDGTAKNTLIRLKMGTH